MQKARATKLGRRLADVIAEREARDPEFAQSRNAVPGLQIANAVTLARVQKNLTQAELAAKIGTTNTAVSRLESGRHVPSLDTVQKVSDALGVAFGFNVRPEHPVEIEVMPFGLGVIEQGTAYVTVKPGPAKAGWIVRLDEKVIATEPTQSLAVSSAKRALQVRGGIVVTHRSTGELREVREVRPAPEFGARAR